MQSLLCLWLFGFAVQCCWSLEACITVHLRVQVDWQKYDQVIARGCLAMQHPLADMGWETGEDPLPYAKSCSSV